MTKRKPLGPEAKDRAAIERIYDAMRRACERNEPKKAETVVGVLAELNEQPREA